MKFHGEDLPRSDKRSMDNALKKQFDKLSIDSELIASDAFAVDDSWKRITKIEEYMNSLDRNEERETIIDLEYILNLLKDRTLFLEKKRALFKVKTEKHQVQDRLEEGDEWKEKTGRGSFHQETVAYYESKSGEDVDMIDAIDMRIRMINEQLAFATKDFELDHPADDLILEHYLKNIPSENLTN